MKTNFFLRTIIPLCICLFFLIEKTAAQGSRSTDSLALVGLYTATNGATWTNKWTLSQPMDNWYGIKLTNGRVTTVNLSTNNLRGSVPLLNLPNLIYLYLHENQLTGTIPNFNLPNLRELNLSSNQFSGVIPSFSLSKLDVMILQGNQLTGSIPIFSTPNLLNIDFSGNQLSGTIPNFTYPNLIELILGSNKLTGSIPDFNLPKLKLLSLSSNQLSGCIPKGIKTNCPLITATGGDIGSNANLVTQIWANYWNNNEGVCGLIDITSCRYKDSVQLVLLYNATGGANWTNKWVLTQPMTTWYGVTLNTEGCVIELRLLQNQLRGTIPNLNLPSLKVLNFDSNQLTGTIPNFSLPNLEELYCYANQLNGNIPNLSLSNLKVLRLSSNQLNGAIPNFSLLKLEQLFLDANQLSGTIPNLTNLPNLKYLDLNGNSLSGTIPNFNLPNLQDLRLQTNQLDGLIPKFNLPKLTTLLLNDNQLTGCIPSEIKTNCPLITAIGGNVSNNFLLTTQSWVSYWNNADGACIPCASITTTFIGTTTVCTGSTTTIRVITNVPSPTYSWSTGENASSITVPAGTYSITVSQSDGCTKTSSVTVTTSSLNMSLVPTAPTCNQSNGSVAANATGGATPFTYRWSTGATTPTINNLAAGSFTVTITDASGCTQSKTATLICIPGIDTTTCRYKDSVQLVALYNTTGGTTTWTTKWDFTKPINTWYGVTLNATGCVMCLDLDGTPDCSNSTYTVIGNGLRGKLPANISSLKSLTSLYLSGNQLSDTIPNFQLPELQALFLSKNQLIGRVPHFNLPKLQFLLLYENQLSDTIPNFNLPNLIDFGLGKNQLSGSIPNFRLPQLKNLWLDANKLSGSIPKLNLPNLQRLELQNNQLNGCIPKELKDGCPLIGASGGNISNNPTLTTQNWANYWNNSEGACIACTSVNIAFTGKTSVCTGSTTTITATTNAVAPTYLWSNGATTTSITVGPGIYTVTVSQSDGCTKISSFTIIGYSLNMGLIPTAPTCNQSNGSITANILVGRLPFTYHWSNGATTATINNLVAGSYTVTVTDDGGCTQSKTATLVCVPVACTNVTIPRNATICEGKTYTLPKGGTTKTAGTYRDTFKISTCDSIIVTNLTVNLSGRRTLTPSVCGTSYTLPSGRIVTSSGTYIDTLSGRAASGCDSIYTINLVIPTPLSINLGTVIFPTCNQSNGTITVSPQGGVSPYNYLWDNGLTLPTRSNMAVGTYRLTVTDANNCPATKIIDFNNCNPAACSNSSRTLNATICEGKTYTLPKGGMATTAGTYRDTFKVSTCDSIIVTILTVNLSGRRTINPSVCGTSYTLPSGRIVTSSGTYIDTLSGRAASGCDSIYTINLVIPTPLSINLGTVIFPTCNQSNGTITVSPQGGVSPYNYLWDNGLTVPTRSNMAVGTYRLTVTDANNCPATKIIDFNNCNPVACTNSSRTVNATICEGKTFTLPKGGMATTAGTYRDTFKVSTCDSIIVTILTVTPLPSVTNTTANSRCGAGTLVLTATASAGTLNWYAASTGGISLGTGASFTTPNISNTTTYYVEATNGSCSSTRTPVTATITSPPSVTSAVSNSRCGAGTVILTATASAGTLNWYATSTGGISLGTGTSFTTPNISNSTTYYVEATNGSCSSTRTPVTATITSPPSVTSAVSNSRCGAGTVILTATPSAGTLNWYAASTGGISLGMGTSFTTPNISNSTTYYVEAVSGSCASTRTPVTATITSPPSVTSAVSNSRCGAGTVILTATASAGTLNWYAANTGGTSLGTGASFTTPNISNTTTYYVEATNGSCSSTRTPVTATITSPPSITSATDNSRCGEGTVILTATPSAGTLNWYAASTGGTSLGTGTSFTTPNISNSTTYYVEATNGSCSSTRTPVTATITSPPLITSAVGSSRCSAGSMVLTATATSRTLNWYAASTGGISLGTGTSFTTPNISNTTTYYVETTNGVCSSTRTPVVATVYPNLTTPVVVKITESACNVGTGTISLTGMPAIGTWTLVPGGQTGTGVSTTITKLGIGTYSFSVITDKGCTSPSFVANVTCNNTDERCLVDLSNNIPTGFTPGGNGANDFFDPKKYLLLSGCSRNITAEALHIYNRWGEMIFKAAPYEMWDGRSTNQQMTVPAGTYYYVFVINVNGEKKSIQGVINLFPD